MLKWKNKHKRREKILKGKNVFVVKRENGVVGGGGGSNQTKTYWNDKIVI